jgi:murein DD-endopeptidase MepM/ murein hydrolase activator NlpD
LFGLGSSLFARRAPLLGAILAILVLATSALVPSSAARAASVGSDRAQTTQLQHAIARKGAEIEALVAIVKPARAQLDALHNEISHDEQLLATGTQAEPAHPFTPQASAVAYVGYRGKSGAGSAFFDSTSSMTPFMRGRHDLDSVKSHLDASITTLEQATGRTDESRERMTQHVDAQQALDQLTRVQIDAQAAITADNATLARVSADLTARLVDRKHHKEAQALRASEHAIAEVLAAATQNDAAPNPRRRAASSKRASRTPRRAATRVSRNGYRNPLRALGGLTPERIDQGVDYGGVGPVYAMGNGVVLNVYSSGWPGGTFIAYRLSDGPAKGLVVFTAEDLNPQVSVGSTVTADTVIGQMFGGPHGIEIGWADGSAIPNAMARSYGQYHGENSTAFGYNFSQLLQSVGAPGGILHNDPLGTLPPGWPQW